jgi:hypothetical protein
MNSEEQSQDFEKLQQLLKLKRYEQPPPRYFNAFSTQVLAHIRVDKSVGRFETADNFISRTPWLRRLWRKLETQPAISGAIATVACGLMVAGVFLMEETTAPKNFSDFTAAGEGTGAGGNLATAPVLGSNLAVALPFNGTNGTTIPTGPNLFEHLPSLQTAPVNQNGAPLWQK